MRSVGMTIGPSITVLTVPPGFDHSAMKSLLSYTVQGHQFTEAFKKGVWDGTKTLYKKNTFPTGLASVVYEHLAKVGYQVAVTDTRKLPPASLDTGQWAGHSLRDYQAEAVREAIKATRGNIVVGTGGGKMTIAAAIVHELRRPALIFVNNVEALHDTTKEFQSALPDVEIGQVGDGVFSPKPVTIATIQSAFKGKLDDVLASAAVLILDEVHHSAADTWFKLAQRSPAHYKFGMTGTLNRQDEKDIFLRAFSGKTLVRFPVRSLIEMGYLSDVDVYFHPIDYPGDLDELNKLSPQGRYLAGIVNNGYRNDRIARILQRNPDVSSVVLINRIEHGELLAAQLGCPFVYGGTPKAVRRRVKEGINSGEITRVVATSLYDESVNNPKWKLCINAAGFSPENAQIQRLGRILRPIPGIRAQFHDFVDQFNSKLKRHSNLRIAYLRDEGHPVSVVSAF